MKKKQNYVIIPKFDYKSEPVKASSAEDALVDFVTTMNTDMNLYFEVIPENEYQEHMDKVRTKMHIQFVTDWMADTLMEDFDIADSAIAKELAELAYDKYCEGTGETEYECIEWAYNNRYEDYYYDDEN